VVSLTPAPHKQGAVLCHNESMKGKQQRFLSLTLLLSIFLLPVLSTNAIIAPAPIVRRHDQRDSFSKALAKQFPSVGRLKVASGWHASGVLIAPQWVVTAGHCTTDDKTKVAPPTEFTIRGKTYKIKRTVPHPKWVYGDYQGYDIGLIELETPVTNTVPAKLYRGNAEKGKEVVMVGYGDIGAGKKETDNTTVARAGRNVIDCFLNEVKKEWGSTVLVADFDHPDGKQNALASVGSSPMPVELEGCLAGGDSGGGVFLKEKGVWYLAGTHTSLDERYTTQYGAWMTFERVSAHVAWIEKTIKGE
jgi:Trypsin